jgi:hypothetical protein
VGDEVMVVVGARHANRRRELRRSNPASVCDSSVPEASVVLVVAADDRRRQGGRTREARYGRAGPRDAQWASW